MPGPLRVVNLRTEYLRNPLIDVRRPRFSWELASNARGTLQEAYRLIVAESESVLDSGTDLIWDSSRVQARDSVHVVYSGPELRPKTRYYWRVITWDNYGNESEQTERAWFEMALLDGSEWEASWIEPDLAPVRREPKQSPAMMGFKTSSEPPEKRLTPPSLLRREFAVRAGIRRARVYCTAHGIYSLEVNGQHADDREFAPEFTAYEKILCYQTYDVTALLIPGTINVLGITIADGWWAGRVGMTGDSCQYGDRHALLLRLEIDYDDGSSDCVVSDESFRCSTGPIAYSDIFIGERYDARKEIPGWSKVGFDASNWKPVKVANYMKGNLVAQHGEPVKRVMEFPAVSVLKTPKGDTVVDIGQVIAGRIRMRVSGPAGIVVSLKHTEVLNEHGNFINNIAGRNKDQEDFYILKGIGDEIWEPKFTFHGFRFVRLTGFPGEPKASDFTAVVISSSMQTSGSFECSDPLLNRLQQNIVWSQRGNMLSIPTDCPQRERAGWTGDIQVYAPTACFNSDMDAFLTRWLRSLAADQLPDGQVPFVVPYLRGYREDIAGVFFTHSSAGWGDACHLVPLTMYKKYGDLRILEECWPVMMKWMDYVEKRAAEHDPLTKMINPLRFFSKSEQDKYLWNSGFHFGDWLIPRWASMRLAIFWRLVTDSLLICPADSLEAPWVC